MSQVRVCAALVLTMVTLLFYGCMLASRGGSTVATWPDFYLAKPLDTPAPVGFCDVASGMLRVIVGNQGNSARSTEVQVVFTGAIESHVEETSEIDPGGTAELWVPVSPTPAGEYAFTIYVDPRELVGEVSESNNLAAGLCRP